MTASDQLHQYRVEKLLRGNRRIKQKEIVFALGISKETEWDTLLVLLDSEKFVPDGYRASAATRDAI